MDTKDIKQFVVIFVRKGGKEKEARWSKECGTLAEAKEAACRAKRKATGYAVYDRESESFIKSKNFAFEDYETGGLTPNSDF